MKLQRPALLVVSIACSVFFPLFGSADCIVSSGVRYDWFTDDRTPETSGAEITLPFGMAFRQQTYSLSLESAFSAATVAPGDEDDAMLNSLTDTLVSLTYRRPLPEYSLELLASVDLNLPTGQASLSQRETFAQAGQSNDLFEVDNFGDGFNASLSVGVVKDLEALSLAAQVAYIATGKFDPSTDVEDDALNPGDQFLGLALADWTLTDNIRLNAFAAYSHFWPDHKNDQVDFQEGDTLVVGSDLYYDAQPFGLTFSVQATWQGKNKDARDGKLHTEAENSNGADVFLLTHVTYQAAALLTLSGLADVRYYGESRAIDETSGFPVEGQRLRYAVGPGLSYRVTEHLVADALVKYFLMDQEPDMTVSERVRTQGVNLDLGFTYTF